MINCDLMLQDCELIVTAPLSAFSPISSLFAKFIKFSQNQLFLFKRLFKLTTSPSSRAGSQINIFYPRSDKYIDRQHMGYITLTVSADKGFQYMPVPS